jgi:glycosyltransferase involved in cell wall biosynthesis
VTPSASIEDTASSATFRVALLTNAPAPYRTELFNELAERCGLLVIFDTKREPDRSWDIDEARFRFDWRISRGLMLRRPHLGRFSYRVLHVPLNTPAILFRFRPDVVVAAELGARAMWAALYCRMFGRPLIIWWEGTPNSDSTGRLRTFIRRRLLKRSSRVWGNGIESAQSLVRYGVPSDCIDLGITGINTRAWMTAVDNERASAAKQVRTDHSLKGAILLFVGDLVPRKGISEMLAALTILAELPDVPDWSLLCVGAGPMESEIDRWGAAQRDIPVARTGFVQPSLVAQYYGAGDVFVMPSLLDPWPLVCLEALVAGLPQVTSSMVGSAVDIITSSEIGDIVDPRDAHTFAERLASRIREAPALVPSQSRVRAMQEWSPEAAASRSAVSARRCLRLDQMGPSRRATLPSE